MFKANPIGVGVLRFREEIGNFSALHDRDAHNFYVLTLAELGVIGIISFLLLIQKMLSIAMQLKRKMKVAAEKLKDPDPYLKIMPLALVASTLAFLVGNI